MKKLIAIFTSVLLLCAMLPLGVVSVGASTVGVLSYSIANGKVTITQCDPSASGELVIPDTIEGYPVTAIGDNAFYNCNGLTAVHIPDGVTTIGGAAFYRCTNMTSVTIPPSVSYIGGNAFNTSGDSISVYITDLTAWCNIVLSNSLSSPLWPSGKLYLDGALVTDMVIPQDVTAIRANTFVNCSSLTSVVIPDGVASIGGSAFGYCPNLTSVTISDSVTTIEFGAFAGCTALTAIDMPNVGISIGWRAFDDTGYYNDSANWLSTDGVNFLYIDRHLVASTLLESMYSYSSYVLDGTLSIALDALTPDTCLYGVYIDIPTSVTYIEKQIDNVVYASYYGNQAEWDSISGTSGISYVYCYGNPYYEPIVDHSVMDTEDGSGLAFRFQMNAHNVHMADGNIVDLTDATMTYFGIDYKLIGMGAVLTNDATIGNGQFKMDDINGITVIDVPTVYVAEVDEDSCAFATRIINIPDDQLERTIYARPYYIVEVDGEEIVVYGDVDSASCAEYM